MPVRTRIADTGGADHIGAVHLPDHRFAAVVLPQDIGAAVAVEVASAKTACEIGRQNLRKLGIAEAIAKAQDKRAERCEVTADWVVDELRKIAGANLLDYVSVDGELDLLALTRDQGAALCEVTITNLKDGAKRVKFRLHDKQTALVSLGRHLGMFSTQHHHDGQIEVVTNARQFIIEQLERLAVSPRVIATKLAIDAER
jgi:phage terminase small subunit